MRDGRHWHPVTFDDWVMGWLKEKGIPSWAPETCVAPDAWNAACEALACEFEERANVLGEGMKTSEAVHLWSRAAAVCRERKSDAAPPDWVQKVPPGWGPNAPPAAPKEGP